MGRRAVFGGVRQVSGDRGSPALTAQAGRLGWVVGACALAAMCLIFGVGAFLWGLGPSRDVLLSESRSPSGKWTVRVYLADPGAMASSLVWAEAIDETGNAREVYFEPHALSAKVVWQSEHAVSINGHLLDVRHDTLDFEAP
jgi:hypothetical protein